CLQDCQEKLGFEMLFLSSGTAALPRVGRGTVPLCGQALHLVLGFPALTVFKGFAGIISPVVLRNLQAAIGAYYDFESPNINVPSMSFVEDVTIGEGESIPPDTQFTKTWRIQNTGTEAWPPGVCLKYVGGDQFGHVNMVMVRSLEPQEIADVSVQMCSPSTGVLYQGQWRMCTATGLYYG
ncbi:PREDICTED: uncharacterized protein C6orf106 homolog, partial [Chlamydotis macqueenii]|uniref:uncharacterized protein C6orf106 homolog n=1 Tax=Chlamydotis macqueenii TaxID=187382 RepID=UPI000529E82F